MLNVHLRLLARRKSVRPQARPNPADNKHWHTAKLRKRADASTAALAQTSQRSSKSALFGSRASVRPPRARKRCKQDHTTRTVARAGRHHRHGGTRGAYRARAAAASTITLTDKVATVSVGDGA